MRKSEQICARVTPVEMARLRALADTQSMLLSEFIRQAMAEKVHDLTNSEANKDDRLVRHQAPHFAIAGGKG
jgi:hypothetical protein